MTIRCRRDSKPMKVEYLYFTSLEVYASRIQKKYFYNFYILEIFNDLHLLNKTYTATSIDKRNVINNDLLLAG
jgi:hypothetical protein